MSRFHPVRNTAPIYNAATHWAKNALQARLSVFTDLPIWTDQNVAALREHFVERPDEGEGTFLEKLHRQLAPTSGETKQLAAEMTWFMLLCPDSLSIQNKRETIQEIWGWSGTALPSASPWLANDVLAGIGSAGTAFNTLRWKELAFLIILVERLRGLGTERMSALLSAPWEFAAWLEGVPDATNRQLRHMALHLLFPDDFERIFGRTDRKKILRGFDVMSNPDVALLSPVQIDRELRNLRANWENTQNTTSLDFYTPPLVDIWRSVGSATTASADAVEEASELTRLASAMTREHVLNAIAEIDRTGFPEDARSTTYDLVHGTRRYPPKFVFSRASEYATGAELSRQRFDGGEASRCFKILRDLGFSIERKNYIEELLKKFLKQADEGVNLVVSEYPKSYRGLSVNVSFGKGNFARIPWISFTGYDQSTSEGIYPVILYYRSVSRLIVAFGISETKAPIFSWRLPSNALTIAQWFERNGLEKPDRYGTSYVQTTFDLSEQPDLGAAQHAVDEVIAQYHAQFSTQTPAAAAATPLPGTPAPEPYSVEEALKGLFIEEHELRLMLNLLRTKKNVILQGPPGVGKTFVCKRLAYALMGEQARDRFEMIQFHQSYSYEDFIQGFRPTGGGGFRLKEGVFYSFCDKARDDPGNDYVFVIDEINRGNLSKIFGEVMMLIEPDKRGKEWQIPLTYSETDEDKFYVPENVFVIGLMNTADRSLAMVDYALRRRFAFVDLEPKFDSDQFWDHLEEKGAPPELIDRVIDRMSSLNAAISTDVKNLGPGYQIGHSYFCITTKGIVPDADWYKQVIDASIAPLLKEYYFDNRKRVDELLQELLR